MDASFALQLGGYMVKYTVPKLAPGKRSNLVVRDATFHFATVRGSGHMVPQDQPNKIFELFSRYISLPTELSTTPSVPPTTKPSVGGPLGALGAAGSVEEAAPSSGAVVAIVVLSVLLAVTLVLAAGWAFKLSRRALPQPPPNDVVPSPLQWSPPRDDIPAVQAKRLGPASQGEASL